MALRLSSAAEQDLDDIYVEGVRLFGTFQAERYSDRLDDCLLLLATQPFLARERTELDKPVRVHAHGSHLVIYETDRRDVLILRIVHQHRDWRQML